MGGVDADEERVMTPTRTPHYPIRAVARMTGLSVDTLRAWERRDLPALDSLLNRHAAVLPAEDLIFLVVLPALREVGARWNAGGIRPAQEHLVSAVIRSVLGALLRTMPRSGRGRTMVLASLSGERHELGLLAAGVLAAAAGVDVLYLGPDLPANDIAHAAVTAGADIVLMSATVAPAITAGDLAKLSRLPRNIDIWAGGTRGPELRSAIGSRVRVIDRLEDLAGELNRHAG
ncbi:MAG: B12-binding domain-containing protein [Acidobacteriota bacterium]